MDLHEELALPSTPAPEIKANWRQIAATTNDKRTSEQISEHYLVEKELARRLRETEKNSRAEAYTSVYNELFTRLPNHPQLTRRVLQELRVDMQSERLRRLVPAGARFMEIGAGDAKLSLSLCDHFERCFAVDVSDMVVTDSAKPANFEFVKTDGIHLPFEDNSIDLVYSNQLMEHLHPDDATDQLREILRVLKVGGQYLCVTPNSISGPHDVSKFFDSVPVGFHLKEYSYLELSKLFKDNGFRKTGILFGSGRFDREFPVGIGQLLEFFVSLGKRLTGSRGPLLNRQIRGLMGIRMIARK